METLRQKLQVAFYEFEALQMELEGLILNSPDRLFGQLTGWNERYSQKGAVLQFLLDSFEKALGAQSNLNEAKEWQDMLQKVMNRQERLYNLLKDLRNKMQKKMDGIKSGKNALSGYHSRSGGDKPVFISREA